MNGEPQPDFGNKHPAERAERPTGPERDQNPMSTPTTPWGLTRLAPFATVTVVPPYTMTLDPVTQTGICVTSDGSKITFRHRKTYRATETPTQASKGDGRDHKQYDSDKDEDSEED